MSRETNEPSTSYEEPSPAEFVKEEDIFYARIRNEDDGFKSKHIPEVNIIERAHENSSLQFCVEVGKEEEDCEMKSIEVTFLSQDDDLSVTNDKLSPGSDIAFHPSKCKVSSHASKTKCHTISPQEPRVSGSHISPQEKYLNAQRKLTSTGKRNFQGDTKYHESGNKVDYECLKLLRENSVKIPLLFPLSDQLELLNGFRKFKENPGNVQELENPLELSSNKNTSKRFKLHSEQSDLLQIITVPDDKPTFLTNATFVEEQNHIINILNKDVIGKGVLARFLNGNVDNACRCKLSELIVNAEYGSDTNATIKGPRFMELAQNIVECFPNEIVDTYYIHSSARGKGRCAAGKLFDSYCNINKELRKANLRGRKKTKSDHSFAILEETFATDDCQVARELEFLRLHTEPWDELKFCWEKTIYLRQKQLRNEHNGNIKVCEYINEYPILKQPEGYLLLEHDFSILFPDAKNKWDEKWLSFSQKLKEQLLKIGVKGSILDCNAALLYNYPQLFNVTTVKIPNKKPWRASRAEIQNGYLVHIKAISDLEEVLEGIRHTARIRGTQVLPIPVIVGETLNDISSSYVVIDNRPIRVESPMRSIELTFKVYHSLHCQYPVQSARLWIVIAKAIFGIEEEWQKSWETPDLKRLIMALT